MHVFKQIKLILHNRKTDNQFLRLLKNFEFFPTFFPEVFGSELWEVSCSSTFPV